MISQEGVERLARFQGFAADIAVHFHEPSAATEYAYEIVAVRGSLMVRKAFISTPSLGEIAFALTQLMAANEWLQ